MGYEDPSYFTRDYKMLFGSPPQRDIRLPAWQAEGLIEDYAHYRRGEAANVSTAVQEVTRHPARSFERFARDYKEVLHD